MRLPAALDQPSLGTPFGQNLGIDPSNWIFDPKRPQCDLTVFPTREHTNHRGTVHGGFIQAVFDEAAAVLVAHVLGSGAAVTTLSTVQFRQSARPKQPIRFEVEIRSRSPLRLRIEGAAFCGQKKIATLESSWLRRPVRARSP